MDWNHNGKQDSFDNLMDFHMAEAGGDDHHRRGRSGGCLNGFLIMLLIFLVVGYLISVLT